MPPKSRRGRSIASVSPVDAMAAGRVQSVIGDCQSQASQVLSIASFPILRRSCMRRLSDRLQCSDLEVIPTACHIVKQRHARWDLSRTRIKFTPPL
jgi:hypothetical protein